MSERPDQELPDETLVSRAQGGDAEAFGALYERYVEQIYRYIRSRVSLKRDAEDLTETVFVRSFEAIEDYEERGHPYSAFLYQVARNVLVDHYRRPDEEQALEESPPVAAAGPGLEGRVVQNEDVERILRAMDELPEDYREVIRLRVLMDLPTATAAEWLDRSDGATRVLLYRALKSLRKILDVERDADG